MTNKMSDGQEQHLEEIQDEFLDLVDEQYRAGQLEHGGNLFDMSAVELLDNAISEAVDEFVYLTTLKSKLLSKD